MPVKKHGDVDMFAKQRFSAFSIKEVAAVVEARNSLFRH